MNLSELLQRPIMGMPLWLWAGVVGGGGIVLAIYLKRRGGSSSSGALGQNAAGQQTIDPNIDPYTGVPYSIESQINPATGLPAYYGGPGVDNFSAGTGNISATPTPAPGGSGTPIPQNVHYAANGMPVSSNGFPIGPPPHVLPAMGRATGPYQATPWWPQATDLDALAHGKEG